MSATFTWSIIDMRCIPKIGDKQNVVVQVNWVCRAREDVAGKVFVQDTFGTGSFGQFDPNAPFIEFNNLTEEQTYNLMALEGSNKRAVEERLQMLLDEMITPAVVSRMAPWLVARI